MIYLSFHKPHLKDSFSYVVKQNLIANLRRHSLPFTLDPNEKRDIILFPSGYDYCYLSKEVKPSDRVNILALSDPEDVICPESRKVSLTSDALNAYHRADRLLVYTKEQKDFLLNSGFKEDKIQLLELEETYCDEIPLESERKSFRSYYQIDDETKLILFMGNDFSKKDIDKIEKLAMLSPDKRFLCFGSLDMSSIKEKKKESMATMNNLLFLDVMPEELYRSATHSVDCLLLYTRSQCFPNVLYDFSSTNTPILSFKPSFNLALLKKLNAIFPEDFPSLYHFISNL